MKIRIATAKYRVLSPVRVPKLATFMIRGILGEKLKLLTCRYRTNILSRKCQFCNYLQTCPYGYLYEQGQDPLRMNSALSPPPRPYVVEPLGKEDYLPEEELAIRLKVATKSKWVDPFIERAFSSIEDMGRDKSRGFGKVELKKVKWTEKEIKPIKYLQERVRVEFQTPTALYRKKEFLGCPTLYDLLVFSARRFFVTYTTYYDRKYQYKFHRLTKMKEKEETHIENIRVEKIERWSYRRKRRENINGLLGSITYSLNNIEDKELRRDIRFLLGFANEMNVGKRAAAGLGKIRATSYSP